MAFSAIMSSFACVVFVCFTFTLVAYEEELSSGTEPSTTTASSKNESVKSELLITEKEKNGSINFLAENNTSSIAEVDLKSVVDGNLTGTTSNSTNTNMNYVIEYKPLVFDSPEDIKTQQEWGGNCTLAHWDSCKSLETWFGKYEDPKDGEIKEYLIYCIQEPIVCLRNSWTVTRCNLLCMSRCNREIQYKYDKYVSHSGECQAHAHG